MSKPKDPYAVTLCVTIHLHPDSIPRTVAWERGPVVVAAAERLVHITKERAPTISELASILPGLSECVEISVE